MHVVGDVGGGAAGGEVGVVAQDHAHALGRYGIDRHVLLGENAEGDFIEADLGQRGGVAIAALRVEIDRIHQLLDGALTVADDMRRFAAGGGDQLVADHQHAEIVAGQVALDHDVAAEAACEFVASGRLVPC